MILPSRLYLLLLTRSRHLYLVLSWLRLHAWRLSSAFQEQLASPPLWRSSLHWRAVHPRAQCIRYNGPFLMGSVTPMAIPFLLLPWLWWLIPVLLAVHRKPWCVLPAGLPFSFICGFPFSPSILIFGSGASVVVTLLPTLFSGVCATSPYLGLVYGAAYLVSPAFEPLSQAYFRTLPLTTLFLLALATAKMGWGATGSLFHSHLCGWGWLPFLHPAVGHQVGVAHPFLPSLLLGDVLSRLCGWSWLRPPTMPGQGSPLVSASGQVFIYRSPSPFRVPTAPCSPFSTNAVSFFWGR